MNKFTKKLLTVIASLIVFMSLAGGSANANTKTVKKPTPPSNVANVNPKDQIKSRIEHLKREMKRLKKHRRILSTEYSNDLSLLNRLENKLNHK
ncbi:hypothetical protein [Acetilactobacillus jinshanensis]|uniref:Uncharacterized protein n=1 Tax=Acetilactobacillus jinshanensis TaxID=1720083 RepID=A0A4P6ZLY2_9LACO|nr:hypothetical protein [Acetilactobacillus jinshanensis]QBP18577.1 hypothetical protein ELX58_05410 [Acetilactobacillus jinshanensis]URL61453.1 hypothetical protein HGK75_05550 [uncultured bacterium]